MEKLNVALLDLQSGAVSIQEIVEEDAAECAEGGGQATQETVLISKDNKKPETITLERYRNRGWGRRLRKRLCSSHRFKNLQVRATYAKYFIAKIWRRLKISCCKFHRFA